MAPIHTSQRTHLAVLAYMSAARGAAVRRQRRHAPWTRGGAASFASSVAETESARRKSRAMASHAHPTCFRPHPTLRAARPAHRARGRGAEAARALQSPTAERQAEEQRNVSTSARRPPYRVLITGSTKGARSTDVVHEPSMSMRYDGRGEPCSVRAVGVAVTTTDSKASGPVVGPTLTSSFAESALAPQGSAAR